uniref:hypothetical protein n=1 Tax=Xanthomonas albilineans TaxID=29447 RepID=UPI0027DE10B2|nr:hypothetical protein [Xanthomonas albilineans]
MTRLYIYVPHTHEGVFYDPPPEGVGIDVSEPEAEFLRALGKTAPPAAPALPPLANTDDASDD